jgi:IS5 family transposase
MQGTHDPSRVELLDAAGLCRHLVPEGSVHAFLADHRSELFPDQLFADLFPSGRGRPSVPADVVATVMVLQALEGLSDREAAAQLRQSIAWKVACGLSLVDPGFHPTVLTLWRTRLRASGRPERIFAAVRAVIAQTGVLKGRQRRALDSTLLDDAVATQDTVTQLVAAIRRVRRLVPAAETLGLAAHDYDQGAGKPACAWDDPEARTRLVSALVGDASVVLAAVEEAASHPGRLHPRRLHRQPPGQHRDRPGRPYRGHHPQRPGGVRLAPGPLPPADPLPRAKDGKTLTLGPHEAELVAARRQATTPAFQASYRRWRPMVERSIAWLVAGGHRRVRYRGLARNQHGLSVRVAAINLRRLVRMGLDHHAGGWVLA